MTDNPIYRDVELRGLGYEPIHGVFQFRDPATAFRQAPVMCGDAVVFRVGSDIWAVYYREGGAA